MFSLYILKQCIFLHLIHLEEEKIKVCNGFTETKNTFHEYILLQGKPPVIKSNSFIISFIIIVEAFSRNNNPPAAFTSLLL